jgi:hypothetical protein
VTGEDGKADVIERTAQVLGEGIAVGRGSVQEP